MLSKIKPIVLFAGMFFQTICPSNGRADTGSSSSSSGSRQPPQSSASQEALEVYTENLGELPEQEKDFCIEHYVKKCLPVVDQLEVSSVQVDHSRHALYYFMKKLIQTNKRDEKELERLWQNYERVCDQYHKLHLELNVATCDLNLEISSHFHGQREQEKSSMQARMEFLEGKIESLEAALTSQAEQLQKMKVRKRGTRGGRGRGKKSDAPQEEWPETDSSTT